MVQPAETAKSPKEEKPLPPNYISKQVTVDNLLSLRNQLNSKFDTFLKKEAIKGTEQIEQIRINGNQCLFVCSSKPYQCQRKRLHC